MTETPTSAKTASHILAAPKAPSSNTIAFTPSAKTMFCFTINSVFLEILTFYGKLILETAAFG